MVANSIRQIAESQNAEKRLDERDATAEKRKKKRGGEAGRRGGGGAGFNGG